VLFALKPLYLKIENQNQLVLDLELESIVDEVKAKEALYPFLLNNAIKNWLSIVEKLLLRCMLN